MSMFGMLGTAGSALRVNRTWLDCVSDNIANINTVRPMNGPAFQARSVVAEAVAGPDGNPNGAGGGVQVQGIAYGDPNGEVVYQPNSPYADANGMVRAPSIDLGDQMVQMMIAQRSYQSNIATIQRAKEMYQQALGIGR